MARVERSRFVAGHPARRLAASLLYRQAAEPKESQAAMATEKPPHNFGEFTKRRAFRLALGNQNYL
jgi:hypothetical protein